MEVFLEDVLFPTIRRFGTAISAYLVGNGVADNLAEDIALGVTAVILLGIELLASYYSKKKVR